MKSNRRRLCWTIAVVIVAMIMAGAMYPEETLYPGPPALPPPLPGSYADRTQYLDNWVPVLSRSGPASTRPESTWPVQSWWARPPDARSMPLILQEQAYLHVRTFRYSPYSQTSPLRVDHSPAWATQPSSYRKPQQYIYGGALP